MVSAGNKQYIALHPAETMWVTVLKDGCDVADFCKDCPLRQCRWDDGEWFNKCARYARDLTLVAALEWCGYDYALTARRLNCGIHHVYRAEQHVFQYQYPPITPEEYKALAVLPKQPYRHWVLEMQGRGK